MAGSIKLLNMLWSLVLSWQLLKDDMIILTIYYKSLFSYHIIITYTVQSILLNAGFI